MTDFSKFSKEELVKRLEFAESCIRSMQADYEKYTQVPEQYHFQNDFNRGVVGGLKTAHDFIVNGSEFEKKKEGA